MKLSNRVELHRKLHTLWTVFYLFTLMFQELLAICLALVAIPFIRWWFCYKSNILDKPGHDVPKRKRVPTIQ